MPNSPFVASAMRLGNASHYPFDHSDVFLVLTFARLNNAGTIFRFIGPQGFLENFFFIHLEAFDLIVASANAAVVAVFYA
jgi:hypothetical protein